MPFNQILKELKKVFSHVEEKDVKIFIQEIIAAKRVYVVGAGRSGLIAKNLAMRLVRVGKDTFVVHETVNPQMKKGDLLVVISGSGETSDILDAAKVARVMGARVISLTADSQSPIVKISHTTIVIPSQIPKRLGQHYYLRELIGVPERSAIKSLFEVCALIFVEVATSRINGEK